MFRLIVLLLICSLHSLLAADLYRVKKCISCHGDNGMTKALGEGKFIGEMRKEAIASVLREYKNGTREGKYKVIMMGFTSKLSESEMKIIADEIGK